MKRILVALLLLAAAGLAPAQQQLEIIRLQHRSAEQVLPQLQPFVEPGGVLSGMNNQLFLRASAANRQQILQILAALDRPPRRLMITVRHDAEAGGAGRGVDGPRARVWDSRSAGAQRASQQVQVVEGGKAFIQVGQSLPIRLHQVLLTPAGAVAGESIVFRDLGSGFYAEPQLAGDTVTLTISPSHDTPTGHDPAGANLQRLTTTVSVRLGEWVDLGGANQDRAEDRSGTLSYSTRELRGTRRVLLKVEELP